MPRMPAWRICVVAVIVLVLAFTLYVARNHLLELWWIPLAAFAMYWLWNKLWNRLD